MTLSKYQISVTSTNLVSWMTFRSSWTIFIFRTLFLHASFTHTYLLKPYKKVSFICIPWNTYWFLFVLHLLYFWYSWYSPAFVIIFTWMKPRNASSTATYLLEETFAFQWIHFYVDTKLYFRIQLTEFSPALCVSVFLQSEFVSQWIAV